MGEKLGTRCADCGKEAVVIEHPAAYRYVVGGLPHVVLVGGVEVERCEACGAESLTVARIAQLHRTIALALASKHDRLSPLEARFLRKYLGHSTADLACLIGVSPETVSRWESQKSAQPIGAPAERLLRMMATRDLPVEAYPTERLADIGDDASEEPLRFEAGGKGWHAAA